MRNTNSKIFLLILLGSLTAFGPLVTDMYLPSLPSMTDYFGTQASMVQLGLTSSMIGLALASSLPVNRSVAIDRETTIPPAPAIPCINRKNIKPSMVAENIQHTVDTINNDIDRKSVV